jgi:cysteinyl-tRNA synthetase
MKLKLYNTRIRGLSELEPIDGSTVRMYACGPTVYNFAHIGNFRTYVSEDILRRTILFLGYKLKHVMNITDVGHLSDDGDDGEDKMEIAAQQKKMSVWDIAKMYTEAFYKDSEKLNIQQPDVVSPATEHIQEMIDLVKVLEDKGFTYIADGNVVFDIDKFNSYGKMAGLKLDELQAGARIEVDTEKHNPYDFVLWFTKSKFQNQSMKWDSPWGEGYPGWHLECSAMSQKYLGDQFDIHCGGVDHINVHHTNEIAQTEAATGKSPWVNIWLHTEFLLMDTGKMSKSKGGFITIASLEEQGFQALDFRYFCLGANYRTQLNFSKESMVSAKIARTKLHEKVSSLPEISIDKQISLSEVQEELSTESQEVLNEFSAALADDLNTSKALGTVWTMLKQQSIPEEEKSQLILLMDQVLGLDLIPGLKEELEIEKSEQDEIEQLIKERNDARKNKDFAKADTIRDTLTQKGISLIDTPKGTQWKKI